MKIKNTADSKEALASIVKKGYVSYSSLAAYRDGRQLGEGDQIAFRFGTELHSRFLERNKINELSEVEEVIIGNMLDALRSHPVVKQLMHGVFVEAGFIHELHGVPVKGYIDILKFAQYAADLKSTSLVSRDKFIESMDRLQPAVYMEIAKVDVFYYVGICKKSPHAVHLVRYDRKDLKEEFKQLKSLLTQIKKHL